MKEYVLKNWKGLIIVLIAFSIWMLIEYPQVKNLMPKTKDLNYEAIKVNNDLELSYIEKVDLFLEEKDETINFYAEAFRIDKVTLRNLLKEQANALDLLNTPNFDKLLIDYLFDLEQNDKSLFNYNVQNKTVSKEYMISLISYYTQIYSNVDFNIASAIAKIESGYRSSYMLKCNNIFGGMSKGKLIKYRTIEYGILKYIKLLSENYFGKGLTTVETIGRVYNPVITSEGKKIASPIWVANVNKALNDYNTLNIYTDLAMVLTLQVEE